MQALRRGGFRGALQMVLGSQQLASIAVFFVLALLFWLVQRDKGRRSAFDEHWE
jgi:steroid 5-alpha reductase family enzyme